jgi:tetratricopeptide (TPR) repeat protein
MILGYLRLGMIAMEKGHASEAADLYKDAIGLDERCKEAWGLLALQQSVAKALHPSRKTFERILSKIDKHDIYSLLALGNIYLQIARHELKGSKSVCRMMHYHLNFLTLLNAVGTKFGSSNRVFSKMSHVGYKKFLCC